MCSTEDFIFTKEQSVILDFFKELSLDNTLKNKNALELGGYYGRDAIALDWFNNITIIDYDKNSVKFFDYLKKEKKPRHNIELKIFDFTSENDMKKNIGEKKYDIIYSYNVLHLLTKNTLKGFLKYINTYLTDTGCMLHVFISDKDGREYNCKNEIIYKLKKQELIKVFTEANFQIKKIEYRDVYETHGGTHLHIMYFIYVERK